MLAVILPVKCIFVPIFVIVAEVLEEVVVSAVLEVHSLLIVYLFESQLAVNSTKATLPSIHGKRFSDQTGVGRVALWVMLVLGFDKEKEYME